MADFPALPLWTDAYLADCDHLTDAEHGRYVLMLMHMWRAPKRRFPNDDVWLARKFRRSLEAVQTELRPLIREFFQTDGNWLFHKRLEREFQRLSAMSTKQSDRAKSRWNKEKDACRGNATTTTTISHIKKESPDGLSKEREEPRAEPAIAADAAMVWDEFNTFYGLYPRKVGRGQAANAYRSARKNASAEEIHDGLMRSVMAWQRNGTDRGYIPHPATWLNGGRWADELFDFKPQGGVDVMKVARELMQEYANEANPFQQGAHNPMPDPSSGIRQNVVAIR
jgi:uncharacterized protein YdaU (DUF1376 family)